MLHLGHVLSILGDLHPDDQCKAHDDAVAFFNAANPTARIEPTAGYSTRLVHMTPIDTALAQTAHTASDDVVQDIAAAVANSIDYCRRNNASCNELLDALRCYVNPKSYISPYFKEDNDDYKLAMQLCENEARAVIERFKQGGE
ncbi:hypothetical protein APY04_0772 [Hyphomicrobium sulfonivorans]|uniref:Uncharacterized protein n=2 Tax=Hyphomicrobium sulfonivorans TaxID=121290 RepID=A0A109BL86_HYPSL|nr:hypothetical protein APY04_0772 [Hyphomicrobium sulfonivorans]